MTDHSIITKVTSIASMPNISTRSLNANINQPPPPKASNNNHNNHNNMYHNNNNNNHSNHISSHKAGVAPPPPRQGPGMGGIQKRGGGGGGGATAPPPPVHSKMPGGKSKIPRSMTPTPSPTTNKKVTHMRSQSGDGTSLNRINEKKESKKFGEV